MTGYTDTIRRWATDTRRAGRVPAADGTGEVGLEAGEPGRRLAVRFTLRVEGDQVTDIRYQVFGCGFSMAACAVAADAAIGAPLDDVAAIDANRLDAALMGLPDERGYCADLAVRALRAAVTSARSGRRPVQVGLAPARQHGPRVTATDPVYALLRDSPGPGRVDDEDCHLYACLLAVAAQEPYDMAAALGLDEDDFGCILRDYFPGISRSLLQRQGTTAREIPPQRSDEVLSILLAHRSVEPGNHGGGDAVRLAHIIAARAAHPGHLWVAMGLFERPELTAAIRRHLPALAEANRQNMRWKRYLFKQVCDRNGGTLCKVPDCGVCSDYALCFADD